MISDAFARLSDSQRNSLKSGNITKADDVLLSSPQEIAAKCKITQLDAKRIIDALYRELRPPPLKCLEDVKHRGAEKCTTGDPNLDRALDGGITTGMVWEIVGESAAGKTQFALQLSLFAQLPEEKGGLNGSICYLTTSSKLPTSRLLQISEAHPMLSAINCGFEDIHTLSTPTIPALMRVLSQVLPQFIATQAQRKPVKLVVVDAIAELFHTSEKTTTNTLVERSKNITEISMHLHALAGTHQIAILVLNEVIDVFNRDTHHDDNGDLVYSDQSRWFSRADSVPGESRKEASLGLVWANQVNARILLSRTGRRRYMDNAEKMVKRPKQAPNSEHTPLAETTLDDNLVLIRRLSVIFSSVSCPVSLDYIVTEGGISVLPGGETYPYADCADGDPTPQYMITQAHEEKQLVLDKEDGRRILQGDPQSHVPPLDAASSENDKDNEDLAVNKDVGADPDDDDEWSKYWDEDDTSVDVYNIVELHASNAQATPQ